MVTHVDEISTPPTPADAPEVFEQRASQVWSDLARAVPQFNQAASEIEQIGQDAGAAKVRAIAEADAAMGYRNEAVAARDSVQADAVSAAQADASAVLAAARAETAAESAETAAASAGNRVPMTGPAGAAILPEGIQADRPDPPPADGLLVRGNTDTGKPEWYNRATEAWEPIGDTSQLATQLGVVGAKVQSLDAVKNIGSGSAPYFGCRAWVNFNGTGTVAIRASGNVSSITDNGVGDYTINFTTAMPDAGYIVETTTNSYSANEAARSGIKSTTMGGAPTTYTTTAVRVINSVGSTLSDPSYFCVSVFR